MTLSRCLTTAFKLLGLTLLLSSPCFAIDNPDKKLVNAYINQLTSSFKSSTLKSLWWVESNWDMDAGPDIGIGQINEVMVVKYYPQMDVQRLRVDWKYNLRMSAVILEDKLRWVRWRKKQNDWPAFCQRYALWGMSDADLALLAYNGVQKDHCFVRTVRRTGKRFLGKLRYYK